MFKTRTNEIDSAVEELKKKIGILEKEKQEILSLSPAQQLAETIHKLMCHDNHIDGCGWSYEKWNGSSYSKNLYLIKATRLLYINKDIYFWEKVIEELMS